jgi:ubiquinone/menaquinone biosynthesis C-methylase UbiE
MPTNKQELPNKLTFGKGTYVVDNEDERINDTDFARLINQDIVVNTKVPLLPAGYEPHPDDAILDAGCGPAGYLRMLHNVYPDLYLVGIDNNRKAIAFARNNEETKHDDHVSFELMDIMEPLNFPDDTFDVVNARFLTGVVPNDKWVDLLRECYRVLKPGGYMRVTEAELSWVAGCPAYERLIDLFLQMLWDRKRSFARSSIAISPMLLKFFSVAGFHDIQMLTSPLNWSAHQPLHDRVTEDMVMGLQVLKDGFFQAGYITPAEFEATDQQMLQELSSEEFWAVWPLGSTQGRKLE